MHRSLLLLSIFIALLDTYGYMQVFIPGVDSSLTVIPLDDELIVENPTDDPLSILNIEKQALDELQLEAQRKVNFLSAYIEQIGTKDPSVSKDQKLSAINQALKLFIDENRKIEVSSINTTEITPYFVEKYLYRLMMMKYSSVEIKWSNIYIAKDLIKVSDSPLVYEGVISVVQTFVGCYNESAGCYQDVTYKNITIRVAAESIFNGAEEEIFFVVQLGDTSVMETKSK